MKLKHSLVYEIKRGEENFPSLQYISEVELVDSKLDLKFWINLSLNR